MEIDEEKVDRAVLALLQLTYHDENRAWKGMDFEVMNRLYEKGYIQSPVNKKKSLTLTDQGLSESRRLFIELFAKK